MRRIIRQKIELVDVGVNSSWLTTKGSERRTGGLKIGIQSHGVHSYWSTPSDEDGRRYPARLITAEDAFELKICPGDEIELAFDEASQGDVIGYAALFRDGRQYATAVVRHARDRSVDAPAVNDPLPISVQEVEDAIENLRREKAVRHEKDAESKVMTTFGGKATLTADDIMEAQRKAERKTQKARDEAAEKAGYREGNGRPAALTEEAIRQAEEYAEKYARALRRGDRAEADRLQSDEIHRQKKKSKKDAPKPGKFDFG